MFEVAALFYGVLASFIMASASRNKREARRNPPVVQLFGWATFAFSAAMAVLLLGFAAWRILAGALV